MNQEEGAAMELTRRFTQHNYPGNYYKRRQAVEQWVRTEAEKSGVLIECPVPLYLTLTDKPVPTNRKQGVICVEAEKFFPRLISFTFDDSFENCRAAETGSAETKGLKHPEHGRVFDAWNIRQKIAEHGMLQGPCPDTGKIRYVEAQLWTRRLPELAAEGAPIKETAKPSF